MSNQSFNLRWQEAMNDLLEQTVCIHFFTKYPP
mgnify:CR=1 FL=1|jgi:hypothetical protein